MEALLTTPILQGILFHTSELLNSGDQEDYAHVFAYGQAVLPFLNVESEEDAMIIEQALSDKDFEFDGNHKMVWIALSLSISGFGIDCLDIGRDTFGVLKQDASFCDLSANMTQFPTPAPKPTVSPKPSLGAQIPVPPSAPSPTDNFITNEINPSFQAFSRRDHIVKATKV